MISSMYYDKQDYALLHLVDQMLESGVVSNQPLFAEELHPHGIKELAAPRETRIAYTVIHLLHSLEEGQATDRIHALSSLYDEVISVTGSTFRNNTGRALIQLMKDLVRGEHDEGRRLMLVHTFRKTAAGNRRFVRKVLRDYHLLEMPEEWNQLAFDHHVHDSHTKGRKTSSHLIMDAWIKGIRSLTVIYYNYVDVQSVSELFQAAHIMGISIQIGIEYRALFRGKAIAFIWEPPSLMDIQALEGFLEEAPVRAHMNEGRSASAYYVDNVVDKLYSYNQYYRHAISTFTGLDMPEISREEFFRFVGAGQPSLLHLADIVSQMASRLARAELPSLQEKWAASGDQAARQAIEERVSRFNGMYPEAIREKWLLEATPLGVHGPEKAAKPDLLRVSAPELVHKLYSLRRKSNITLSTAGLTATDVLELLYSCQGHITHLETFNLKEYAKGLLPHQEEICALQYALNQETSILLKRLITDLLAEHRASDQEDRQSRCEALTDILYNIPKLKFYYRRKAIKTRIGSDATNRSSLLHGMGFAYIETLPHHARKEILHPQKGNFRLTLPLKSAVEKRVHYSPQPQEQGRGGAFRAWAAKLFNLRFRRYSRRLFWSAAPETVNYQKDAESLTTLGGLKDSATPFFSLEPVRAESIRPGLGNMNTRLLNISKVVAGFLLAMGTFAVTQSWWGLVWLGAPIWFIITGGRNVLQAVLAGRGFTRTSLLHWKDYINWTRLCDSLLYTGISVPLLDLVVRWLILGKGFGISANTHPLLVFLVVATVNGTYISSHNAFRGLQKEVIIGNFFRSALAIPLSLAYNSALLGLFALAGIPWAVPILTDAAAIISKAASDTMAGILEGIADRRTNLEMRRWDYNRKLRQFFACYDRLDALLPETQAFDLLGQPGAMFVAGGTETDRLQRDILAHSLDLLYFFYYQPRARTELARSIRAMSQDEREIFLKAQLVLTRERGVSQLLLSGQIVRDFGPVLAFYLARHRAYLSILSSMTRVPVKV